MAEQSLNRKLPVQVRALPSEHAVHALWPLLLLALSQGDRRRRATNIAVPIAQFRWLQGEEW